jgi:molecular chaperone GrpE
MAIFLHATTHHILTNNMISRTVFRQSKALAACVRSTSKPLLARPQFRPASLAFASASRPISSARWYSTESEVKEGEAAATGQSAQEAEDPIKKELNAKDKEITELKVCDSSSHSLTNNF